MTLITLSIIFLTAVVIANAAMTIAMILAWKDILKEERAKNQN